MMTMIVLGLIIFFWFTDFSWPVRVAFSHFGNSDRRWPDCCLRVFFYWYFCHRGRGTTGKLAVWGFLKSLMKLQNPMISHLRLIMGFLVLFKRKV